MELFVAIMNKMDILSSTIVTILITPITEHLLNSCLSIGNCEINHEITAVQFLRNISKLLFALFGSLLGLVSIFIGPYLSVYYIFTQDFDIGLFSIIRPFCCGGAIIAIFLLLITDKKKYDKLGNTCLCIVIFFGCSWLTHQLSLSMPFGIFCSSLCWRIIMLMAWSRIWDISAAYVHE